MITTGAKFWYGLTFFSLIAAVVYFVSTSGEEFGAVILVAVTVSSFILGTTCAATRDCDLGTPGGRKLEVGVLPRRSAGPAPWPVLGAIGAAVSIVGLAGGNALFYVGIAIIAAVLAEWMVQGWAERSTYDAEYNRDLRNRVMYPIEFPVLAAATIALVVISFSRILLALSKTGSTVISIVVAATILAVAFLIAARPRLSANLLSFVLAIAALGLIAGGITSAVVGERKVEKHETPTHSTGSGDAVETESTNTHTPKAIHP